MKELLGVKKKVLGQLPRGKLPPNPKTYPNPNRGAIFLGGNCPDTEKVDVDFKRNSRNGNLIKKCI